MLPLRGLIYSISRYKQYGYDTINPVVKCYYLYISRDSHTDVTKPNDSNVRVSGEAKGVMLPKKFPSLFESKRVPSNFAFPNQKGIDGFDPEMAVKEILKEFPHYLTKNVKMLVNDYKESISIEKREIIEHCGGLQQGEARKEYTFEDPEAFNVWNTGCDSDWGQGYSKCEFIQTDRKTALFRGKISTELIKDGQVERAGWAAIKLEDHGAFRRKKYFTRWSNFSHLLVKCRGDGRSYKVMLYAPGEIDLTWGNTWSYPLHTHGGPYWQYEKIPFSRFFHTVYGRIQDRQNRVPLNSTSSIGIALMDRIDGEFSLEIDFIGVCHDRSHQEKFAYETYSLPLFNTDGF